VTFYNTISFLYVLINYPRAQNEYYMSEEMRWLKWRISSELALKRMVKLSDVIEDAQEVCLTGIDVNPLEVAKGRGINDVDYYFGVLGPLDWTDASTYITIFRDGNKATIVRPDYFYIEDGFGDCAKGNSVLRASNVGILFFKRMKGNK
ncbi:hypothetical protein AB4144_28980, partial [Rhizobiaceae sp. 2RAB30]